MDKSSIWAVGSVVALSGLALAAVHRFTVEARASMPTPFSLSSALDRADVTLADGRALSLHDGALSLAGRRIALSSPRRFASLTVMPTGQVLVWGGIDDEGRLIETGEWFEPSTSALVTTGRLGLPPRAGHTLNVLSDGTLAMTGGWGVGNVPAHDVALWRPLDRHLDLLAGDATHVRLKSEASLLADGTLQIVGGVDEIGRPVHEAWRFGHAEAVAAAKLHGVVASYPTKDNSGASPIGPLSLRFSEPVDVAKLGGTVSLLGPNGVVKTHVVGVESGRLAFVQLPDELYPAARYTIFVQGLHTAKGDAVPYEAIGFTTKAASNGVVLAGEGKRPGTTGVELGNSSLFVMAGAGKATPCKPADAFHLCREKGLVKDGAFYPGQDNVATSSGGHWRLYKDRQTLPDTRQLEANLPKGATVLIGQVRQIDETPVANVEISVDGQRVRTDRQGVFLLQNVLAGRRELFVDGRPAGSADTEYGRFVVGADVTATTVNHMPFVMYLPRVLARDKIALPSPTTRETVLTHPDMPGLELRIPAGAVFKDRDGKVLNEIAIVPTPVDHSPFPLPDNFPMYFTIQPGDAVVQGMTPEAAKGIQIVYPNYGKQKPADKADFWVYSAEKGWEMYGAGHVSADAKQLVADKDTRLVWALGAGASANPDEPSNDKKPDNKCDGDPVDLQTGLFFTRHTDLYVKDTMPLVVDRSNNGVLNFNSPFGVGSGTSLAMTLSSADGLQNPKVVLSCGESIRFHLVAGQAVWPLVGTVWQHADTASEFHGATLQFLNDATPEAAHWVMTLRDGSQYWFDRHAPNKLAAHIDRFGNTVRYTYNGGLLNQVISPNGRSISFGYNSKNLIQTVTDHTGRAVLYDYVAFTNVGTGPEMRALRKVTFPDGTSEEYTYQTIHNGGIDLQTPTIKSIKDRRGNVQVENTFDPLLISVVTSQKLADGSSTAFDYERDASGIRAVVVTDAKGNKERTEFDATSRYPSKVIRGYGTASALETTYRRSTAGLLLERVDGLQRKTVYQYDALGNQVAVTRLAESNAARTTRREYTPDNLVSKIKDDQGRTTRLVYVDGCLQSLTNPDDRTTTYTCDASGNVDSMTNPDGAKTRYRYVGGDLAEVIDAKGGVTRLTYDALGRTTSITTADNAVSFMAYDVNDRLVSYTDAIGAVTSLDHDGNGNVTGIHLPNGSFISYDYDAMNRVIARYDALGNAERRTYNANGNIENLVDRKGQVTTFSYDEIDRPVLLTYADGSETRVTYDKGDRMVSLLDSSSGELAWSYDDMDHVLSESSAGGVVRYAFDESGRRSQMVLDAGEPVEYGYDDENRTSWIAHGPSRYDISYDGAGRRESLRFPNGMHAGYGYDAIGRLLHLTYEGSAGDELWKASYSYDAMGRRVSEQNGPVSAPGLLDEVTPMDGTFDASSQIAQRAGTPFNYDKNGNLVSDGRKEYRWDARNRLAAIKEGGVEVAAFAYDALGRRVLKTANGRTVHYVYDGQSVLRSTDDMGASFFIEGPRLDEHLAVERAQISYYITDDLHSTVATVSHEGGIEGRFSYSAYGRTSSDLSAAESLGYTGREQDLDDLYYYRARYYSASLGRFISEDPIGFGGGGLNFHAYVNGDPISQIDPLGLRPLTDCEKRVLAPYIPQEDLDKADVHDGDVPWYLPKDMDGITRGHDIYFRPGAYPYGTPAGFQILAHELVHVGQYRDGMTWISYLLSVRSGYAEDSKYEKPAYDKGLKVRDDLKNKKNPCNCGEGES